MDALTFPEPDAAICIKRSGALELPANTIDLWSFALTGSPASVAKWRDLLDASERARADGFIFERLRIAHIVAHGITRWILGRYTRTDPGGLRFSQGEAGKPWLTDHASVIAFNLSHSPGGGLLAVARQAVGADLERIREDVDHLSIAEHCFIGDELVAIRSVQKEQQIKAFYRYWVAKESVLKAEGVGLGFPLDSFAVACGALNADEASIWSRDPGRLRSDWCVRMVPTPPGWSAAVTARGSDWAVRLRSFGERCPQA